MDSRRFLSPRLIVGAASLLNLVSYLDRSCISIVAPKLQSEFHLSATELGLVFGSFSLSYGLFQIPWGVLADRIGPRWIVATAITAWSAFTALTGMATSYFVLVLVRFTFGMSEAGLSPAITSAIARWVPARWRSTAFGLFLGSGRIGGAVAPLIAASLLPWLGWRSMFALLAIGGVIALGVWLAVTPSHGSTSVPKRTSGSLMETGSFQFLALLFSVLGYTFMWQFFATWFPTYLIDRRGFTLVQAAGYASLPFLLGIGSNWAGGVITDILGKQLGPLVARGVVGCTSLTLAALLFRFGISGNSGAAVWMLAAAAGVGDLFLPAAWSMAAELGGPSAGIAGGALNTASNFGGFLAPVILGAALQRWKSWDSVLMLDVWVTLASACMWGVVVGLRKRTEPGDVHGR